MISAKIVADSINANGNRITTYELEYPRFIHAEFMTHRLFSRNAASSRAIPVARAIELIQENTAMPIHWGKNQPGMSAKEECNDPIVIYHERDSSMDVGYPREQWWNSARDAAINHAYKFNEAGYHKQIVNRLLEPYSHIKVVCTATEFDNFFYLRCHKDAQPEIQELASQMFEARLLSAPTLLEPGSWHVPYYDNGCWDLYANDGVGSYNIHGDTLEEAIAISASCCAQVSYRRLDDSLEKAQAIYKRLMESKPSHASPFEHQATPMKFEINEQGFLESGSGWEVGITHIDRFNENWSGNFKGWIQNRQLIGDNYCGEFNP